MRYVVRLAAVGLLSFASTGADLSGQDTVSGKFYRFEIVGRSGLGPVSDVFFEGPSINDKGAVAFTGRGTSVNAVFVTDPGPSTPRLIAQQANTFSFLGGIQLNNDLHLIANESPQANPDGTRQYFLRDWNAPPSASAPLVAGLGRAEGGAGKSANGVVGRAPRGGKVMVRKDFQ
jgi:hypothetical protein